MEICKDSLLADFRGAADFALTDAERATLEDAYPDGIDMAYLNGLLSSERVCVILGSTIDAED